MAHVAALGVAGAAQVGPWGVVAASRGAGGVSVGLEGW